MQKEAQRKFAIEVVRRLQQAGHRTLWAGGCVRDLLMGRVPKDYDVATTATPEEVRRLFGRKLTLAVGESFGVVIVLAEQTDQKGIGLGPKKSTFDSGQFTLYPPRPQVEVATFRSDGRYLDGRRPESVQYSTPELDAQRRDFTINGMFFDPITEEVFDYVDGRTDLRAGLIRAIGRPQDRMTEDKLRMLRAVRFASTLQFELDAHTHSAIKEMAPQLTVVSAERIAQELRRMLVHPERRRAMHLAQSSGLLEVIITELSDTISSPDITWFQTQAALHELEQPSVELALAVLFRSITTACSPEVARGEAPPSGCVWAICRRLKLSNHETEHIGWLSANRTAFIQDQQMEKARLYRLLANSWSAELLELHRVIASATGQDLTSIDFAKETLQTVPPQVLNPPMLVNGKDLLKLGLSPGPDFKVWLDTVRDAQLNGQIETHAEAMELVSTIAQAKGK